ncbi:50S ribosomal protein L24 [bacterium]|nr:50S ribosomal protein L24 [bacterium]
MANNSKKSLQVKTGDRVMVIAGKDKGKIGNINKIDTSNSKVYVEGANMVTKAQKANPMANIQGGLVKVEAPLDNSNVMIVCPACEKVTKVKHEVRDGKKVRVCKKCGEKLDV